MRGFSLGTRYPLQYYNILWAKRSINQLTSFDIKPTNCYCKEIILHPNIVKINFWVQRRHALGGGGTSRYSGNWRSLCLRASCFIKHSVSCMCMIVLCTILFILNNWCRIYYECCRKHVYSHYLLLVYHYLILII